MAQEPDRLRQDIENTRASLTRDVDLLAEKTSPKQAARRRWTSVKEKVMGSTEHARNVTSDTAHSTAGTVKDTAHSAAGTVQEKASQLGDRASDLGGTVSEKAHDLAGTVKSAPQTVTQQTQGNPIAAGIIAFGIGMLTATLLPVTEAEKHAGEQIKERSGDLTDKAKEVASGMKDDVAGTVQQAAGELKETATDAVQQTKQQAQSSAQDAKEQSKQAVSNARS
jgi:uncharacterized protein YjbJ (UPF0337 family)